MANKLFRQQATDTFTSPEQVNDYIRVTGPSLYVMLTAMVLIVAAVIVWASYGSVADYVKVKGVVFPHEGMEVVSTPHQGVVTQQLVRRGDIVRPGDALFRFVHDGVSGVVTAPKAGVVLASKNEREHFQPYEACVYLLPQQAALQGRELVAYVAFTDLRKLHEGMEVQVSPADMPREEFGYMLGRIVSIDRYPSTRTEAALRFKMEELASLVFPEQAGYEVRIVLDEDPAHPGQIRWSHSGRGEVDIRMGTLCELQIVTQRRPVLEMLFKSKQQAKP